MVALVTGAAVGIGRAIALALLAQGMDTWLADVQDPEGPEGRFVRVDVTDDVGPARVNCIVPGWIATPRGLREAAAMTDAERAAASPMVAMKTITAAVGELLADDTARGRVLVL